MFKNIRPMNLIPILLAPIAVTYFLRTHPDPDTFWHLATGRWILANKQIPYFDPFALSNARTWIDHEWLSQTIFAYVYQLGYIPLVIFTLLLSLLSLGILYKVLRKRCLSPSQAISLVLFFSIPLTDFLSIRPQLFTYLLAISLVYILESWPSFKVRLCSIAFIMVLWVNLHGGGASLAFVILLGYLVVAFVNKDLVRVKDILLLTISAFLLLLINPYGSSIVLYPYKVMLHSDFSLYITEWRSPDFHVNKEYLCLLIVTALSIIWSKVRLSFKDTSFLLGFFCLSLLAGRHIALFSLLAPVYLVVPFSEVFKQVDTMKLNIIRAWKALQILSICAAILISIYSISKWPGEIPEVPYSEPGAYNYLRSINYTGDILNPYNLGGSLLYYFSGEIQPSIDGRADMYSNIYNSTDVFSEQMALFSGRLDPKIYFSEHPTSLVIVSNKSWFFQWLTLNSDFETIYVDQTAAIFRNNSR